MLAEPQITDITCKGIEGAERNATTRCNNQYNSWSMSTLPVVTALIVRLVVLATKQPQRESWYFRQSFVTDSIVTGQYSSKWARHWISEAHQSVNASSVPS